jgi:flavodoxin I
MIAAMDDALKRKGAVILGSWHCRGAMFALFNRGHPDEADLAGARQWAREMRRGT